jgi:nucleolar protein 56
MLLVTKWYGTFLFTDDMEPVKHVLFPKEPQAIAKRLMSIEDGKILSEERKIVQSEPLESFSVFERRLEALGGILTEERPVDLTAFEYDKKILHDSMMELSKRKLKTEIREDEHIVHAISALDEQTHAVNILFERLREWYAIHFPELEKLVPRERFVALISEKGSREEIDMVEETIGIEISDGEKEVFKLLGNLIIEQEKSIEVQKRYIEDKMKTLAPNLNHLAGPLIGARLIAFAKGLERLARMPSSTVQLLGAEKSLFKHLKDGSKPPKHGIIFQHPMVHKAPRNLRGRIARTFASKISIAARADFYSKNFIAVELKESLDKAMTAQKHQQKI